MCILPSLALAGAPDLAQTQYFADVIQTSKEQGLNLADLGTQILLAIAGEIGTYKVLAIIFLFLCASVGGTLFGIFSFLRRKFQ